MKRLEQFYNNVNVQGRYLAWPLERYTQATTFEERNDAFIESALALGEKTICNLLEQAGIRPQEVRSLAFGLANALLLRTRIRSEE